MGAVPARRLLIALTLALSAVPSVPAAAGQPASARDNAHGPAPHDGVWLAGDLHIHTCYSHDAYCPPNDDNTGPDEAYTLGLTVQEQFCSADQRGLDYLAITDHNDVRSVKDPGFGACDVTPVAGYEASYKGHAQMLGAREVLDAGDESAGRITAAAERLRADGGTFQVNHPANGSTDFPHDADWEYGYDVVPDTVEVWNISTLWQPPFPSGSSNDDAIRYWEGWLDRGHRVGATGGSDNHWRSTHALQGPGQPTTWVFAESRTEADILEALSQGRTFVSAQPPAYGGARAFLEADADGDGVYESMVGDTVPAGTPLRVRVEGAPGALLRVVAGGKEPFPPVPVTSPGFEHRFTLAEGASWVRAEVLHRDLQAERAAACDPVVGGETTYCRNRLALLALTSAIYLEKEVRSGPVYARVEQGRVVLGNEQVERSWTAEPFGTEYLLDKRTGLRTGASDDLQLSFVDAAPLTGRDFALRDSSVHRLPDGGVNLTLELARRDGLPGRVIRTVTAYPGIAGFRTETSVEIPGLLSRYVLDEVNLPGAGPEIHAFRAGYDWRGSDTPDWEPALSPFGGHHSGDHRVTTRAGRGQALQGEGEWLSLRTVADPGAGPAADGPRAFLAHERVDYASTRMEYDGAIGRAAVDLRHDLAYLGPFESDVHVGNPGVPARYRTAAPGRPLDLESVFTGLALDADDEAWQHYKYFEARSPEWDRAVVFNSNGVDSNRISTGAKDDMDMAEVQKQAAVARRLGVETFVLDDGWQATAGDWCPDSPPCPEPRGTYPPRFPDAEFRAVREAIAPMKLGLWMSPMHFNPASEAYERNPQWNCEPIGEGLVAVNRADPGGGSNESGIGTWNPEATGLEGRLIDFIEGRIRRAIDQWGVRYFKFDYLVWIDCAGMDTVTAYDYRDSFVRMLDRLIARYPDVTFQIDETNDYRLFPFESAYRGPSWYANGHPKASEALHNLWILAPYVPPSTIGQAAYGQRGELPSDYLMAVALASHMTFFTDLTKLTDEQVATARRWTDLYREHRDRLAMLTYPLLDDPLSGKTWTALQPWNPETGTGALLVFRQDSPDASRTVPLRGIRGDGSFRLTNAETGKELGVFAADQLRAGIDITLPSPFSAAVLLIDPAQ